MQIIPAILEQQYRDLEDKVLLVKNVSKWIQIDVMDGSFGQYKTFELELLTKIETTENVLWDIHLMVKEPIKWLEKCLFVGAARVTGQVEMMSDRQAFVDKAHEIGFEAGLAFDVDTPIDDIPLDTDLVLAMTRKAGFNPSEWDESVLEKLENINITKAVDGGITNECIPSLLKHNIDIAYVGNAVFNGNVMENYELLKQNASKN